MDLKTKDMIESFILDLPKIEENLYSSRHDKIDYQYISFLTLNLSDCTLHHSGVESFS